MPAAQRLPTIHKSGGRLAPRDNLIRTVVAVVAGKALPVGGPEGAMERMYPGDEVSPLVLKAAVSGATTTTPGWASELSQAAVSDLITNLGPASAGSQLLRAGLVVPRDSGELGVTVPGMTVSAAGSAFVGEGAPAPVKQFPTSAITLPPRKIMSLVAFSREMAKRTSFEEIVRSVLIESVGATLDSVMFSDAAATAVAPAGLRAGVAAIAASAGGGDAAMARDLGNLAAAVAPVGGDRIAFVAAPAEAVKIRLRGGSQFAYPVFASPGLPSGAVMAVALPALAAAIDPRPEIEAANAATLHFDDSDLAHISTGGGVAAPTRSIYQTNELALRVALGVNFALRAPGSVAWVASVAW